MRSTTKHKRKNARGDDSITESLGSTFKDLNEDDEDDEVDNGLFDGSILGDESQGGMDLGSELGSTLNEGDSFIESGNNFVDMTDLLADSSKGKRSSSIKMFNQFLKTMKGLELYTWETLPPHKFSLQLLGRFPTYMMSLTETKKIACQTCLDYVSHIKCAWQGKYSGDRRYDSIISDDRYRKLRKNITKAYIRRCIAQNIPFATTKESMSSEHLTYLLEMCFKIDTLQALRDRCLFAFDWVAIGRINEVFGFKFLEHVFHQKASQRCNANRMVFKMMRGKTGKYEDLLVYLHRDNWKVCPFHSLASLLVVLHKEGGRLFTDNEDGHKGDVQHVNRVLKNIYEAWIKDNKDGVIGFKQFTSHHIRRGATQHGNEHPLMQTAWLLFQGGWSLDRVQTLFNYLAGSVKIASKAGLAMTDWEALEGCGFCPGMKSGYKILCMKSGFHTPNLGFRTPLLFLLYVGIDAIPPADKDLFSNFVVKLFPHHAKSGTMDWMYELAGVLLLHYKPVQQEFAEHSVIQHIKHALGAASAEEVMREVMDEEDISNKLNEWADNCRKWFILKNGILSDLANATADDVIPIRSVYDHMQRQGLATQQTNNVLLMQEQHIAELIHAVKSLSHDVKAIADQNVNIIRRLEDIESRIRRNDNVGVSTSGHINSKDNDHNDDVRTTGIVSSSLHTMTVRRPRQTTLSSGGYFNMAPSVGIVNTPPHPKIHTNILANDMAKVNLVTLWCEWFKNKLYNSTFEDLQGQRRSDAKSKQKKAARLIYFMKLFQPVRIVIDPCPNDVPGRLSWNSKISEVGHALQEEALAFLRANSLRACGDFTLTQQQFHTLAEQGALVDKSCNNVIDNVTCTQFNYTTIQDLKLTRKSEETKQRRADTLSNIRLQIVAMGDRRMKK